MRFATTLLALVSVICAPVLAGQSTSRHSLEGTWRVTEIVVTGEGAYVATQAQPSVFIFTKRYYSLMWTPGNVPRTVFRAKTPTNEEKLAAFDSFVGGAGTYDVVGQTLNFRPIVSKGSTCGAGVFIEEQFNITNNTLTLNWTSNATRCPLRETGAPLPKPTSETRMTLVRIE